MSSHGRAVEQFYSHGAERRALEANGFLSFGYWPEGTKDYAEAAQNLLDLLLAEANIEKAEDILNVCCGNGIETVQIFQRVQPRRIYGVDITRAHIETSRKRAAALGLSDRMIFEHGDATRMPYADGSFSHIIGIEGIAHFDTREKFFDEARRLLKPGGMLMLSDCILHRLPGGLKEAISARACPRLWHVPPANRVDAREYRRQLERAGFRVEELREIGKFVYPGFARFNVTRESIRNAIEVRGLAAGLGLTFICWLLGDAFKRGMSEYLIVKAFKV